MRLLDFITAYVTIIVTICLLILMVLSLQGCGIDAPVSPTINVTPNGVIDNLPELGCTCPNLDLSTFVLVPKL